MINFIICDNDTKYLKLVKNVIDKYMMKNSIDYRTHLFTDYDDEFLKIVENKLPFKIYILDIEAPTRSGIDVARIIRHKDVDSIIIFLTGHNELSDVVVKDDFMFLSFVNKFDNCEKRLVKVFNKAFQFLKVRPKIRFKDNGVVYTIALNDILYITRDSVDRKCVIKTDNGEYKVGKSLSSIMELLDKTFIQTHRSCIVNTNRITSYSKSKRMITFDNNEKIDLISEKFDGELIG